jgi:hypothetical protein
MGNYQRGASLDLYLNDNQLRFDSKLGKIPHILLRMIHFENRAGTLGVDIELHPNNKPNNSSHKIYHFQILSSKKSTTSTKSNYYTME